MNGPEIRLLFGRPGEPDDFLQRESFPGRAEPGPGVQLPGVVHAREPVQQAAVAEIYLRRLDLPLADVLKPRGQTPHHQRANQRVQVTPHGRVRHVERAAQIGCVEHLPVIMREHHPEPAQRGWRNLNAERRDVALQKRADVKLAPLRAVRFARREKRQRKSAAQPELLHLRHAHFTQRERRDFHKTNPSGQCLRSLPDQIPRGAAQNQKARGRFGPVRQHAQDRKQIRAALDFVNHHQAVQPFQRELRIFQPVQMHRVFPDRNNSAPPENPRWPTRPAAPASSCRTASARATPRP